jgi:hypothetical protein
MPLRTNASALVTVSLVGEVWPPLVDPQPYAPGVLRPTFLLPGMGGVTHVRIGSPAFGWAADHLEPGAKLRRAEEEENNALQFLACLGNRARILDGPAAGAEGVVTGTHAYVMVDFEEEALDRLRVGDRVLVEARGQGLVLLDHPSVVVKNVAPELLLAMGVRTAETGELEVPVRRILPAEAAGAGVGMISEYANLDLMFCDAAEARRLGIEDLRLGDVVALQHADHRWGRGFRRGAYAIGVVSTGMCQMLGHGPGVTTVLAGGGGDIVPVLFEEANLADILAIGTGEKR